MSQWWLAQLNPEGLSQGDVLSEVIVPVLDEQTFLRKETLPKVGAAWLEGAWSPSQQGLGHYLGKGRIFGALVLSHSCELDKKSGKERVWVAPIAPISNVSRQEDADKIMAGERFSAMPLPAVPQLGDCYADLRVVGSVARSMLENKRVASMAPQAVERLQFQLVAFLTRLPLDKLRGSDNGPA